MRRFAIIDVLGGPCGPTAIEYSVPEENDVEEQPAQIEGMRTFPTGANRNDDTHKPDPEAFWSPLVLKCYNDYIQSKRKLKDGTLRASDNWQLGMPMAEYAKSLMRHVLDFHLHHRGFGDLARASLKTALCAIIFNTQGYLHELLKKERQ